MALDAIPIDKELGTVWAYLSALRPLPDTDEGSYRAALLVLGAPSALSTSVFTIPGFSRVGAYLSRPLGALASGGATLVIALSALAAYYVGIEKTLGDDTFGTFTDYVTALGLASIASGASVKSATNLTSLVPREPSSAAGEQKADKKEG